MVHPHPEPCQKQNAAGQRQDTQCPQLPDPAGPSALPPRNLKRRPMRCQLFGWDRCSEGLRFASSVGRGCHRLRCEASVNSVAGPNGGWPLWIVSSDIGSQLRLEPQRRIGQKNIEVLRDGCR